MDETKFEKKVEDAAEQAGGLLRSKYGLWALGGISFAESALPVPLVTDPFLSAFILADRQAVWRGVGMVVVTSVIGGIFAYATAYFFFDLLATKYLVGNLAEDFYRITEEFNKGTLVITLLGAITPVPYTIVAMAAGFTKANILIFIIGSVLGRIVRYGIVGWLTHDYGHQALAIARRHLMWVSAICFVLAFMYFLYLFY